MPCPKASFESGGPASLESMFRSFAMTSSLSATGERSRAIRTNIAPSPVKPYTLATQN